MCKTCLIIICGRGANYANTAQTRGLCGMKGMTLCYSASSMFSGSVEVSVSTEISGGLNSLKGSSGTEPLVDMPRVM